jgi:hypothetical protein
MNLTSKEMHFPSVIFYMPPGTSSGWHNGTLAVEVDGTLVSDKLELNILVPEIQSTSQASANGTLTYMFTEAYSPYFSNVGEVLLTWRRLGNIETKAGPRQGNRTFL